MYPDPEEINLTKIHNRLFIENLEKQQGKEIISIGNVIIGKSIFKNVVDWGNNKKIYKWRWNETHIDIGRYSIYNLPQKGLGKYFWKFIALIIKPMRRKWHIEKFGRFE